MHPARRACPSCHHRVSPFTLECPVCGLSFGQRVLPRPLLFQASALRGSAPTAAAAQALRAPALGRVAPIQVGSADSQPLPGPTTVGLAEGADQGARIVAQEWDSTPSFWPLVVLEALECLSVVSLNLVLAGLVSLTSSGALARIYSELWPFLLPMHLMVSWALFMIPMVLTGQTLLMAPRGIVLGSDQPERRIAFSVLHLLSVSAFPVSFLCLVLTRDHRTLAELLSGQEVLLKPEPRIRG